MVFMYEVSFWNLYKTNHISDTVLELSDNLIPAESKVYPFIKKYSQNHTSITVTLLKEVILNS